MRKEEKFILWFKELSMRDLALVGGKNASLGEMYSKLTKKGINVPDGFALTAYAYRHFLEYGKIKEKIHQILSNLKVRNISDLAKKGNQVRQLIMQTEFSPELEENIIQAYRDLSKKYKKEIDTAVRSSATAEDLPGSSFAGQLESFLNIHGEYNILQAVHRCFASLFTNRAIVYREEKGFSHFEVALSVGVQKMARGDMAGAGVMFTLDTESGFRDVVSISAAYGLGESVVQGRVNPDQYYVFKPALAKGYASIIDKKIGAKKEKVVYSLEREAVRTINVSKEEQERFVLTDKEILLLAQWGMIIEKYYQRPMDIEWVKDGLNNKLYIVQARPETIHAEKKGRILEEYVIKKKGKVLVKGLAVGARVGRGRAHFIKDASQIGRFKKGEVLITEMTNPDWVPIMKIAGAIVTNSGGKTCHAAIVSRELGIPCLVAADKATEIIKQGQEITVSCAEGEIGKVYQGLLPFYIKKTDLAGIKKTKTQMMLNIGEPDIAFEYSFLPHQGIGLAREEFIISNWIKIHPLALLNYEKESEEIKEKIDLLTAGYKDKKKYFVEKLSQGIGRIAAAFYPHDVIVRFSDFKSNEYADLIGGEKYEPKEANPMIGWRGASRYYDPQYKPAFLLECQALIKAREEMGLDNIIVMVPFCRTLEEGKRVLKVIREAGLKKVKVYMMVEIPSNVILLKEFSKVFDGFSLGTNDLTQLTLGLDRDSSLISSLYNEENEAVKSLVLEAVKTAKKCKRKIGICGQAPSDNPKFAQFLIQCGIDSISLNPDVFLSTTLKILEIEKRWK